MVFEPLRFGKPINHVLTMNRFWTKVWLDNPGNAGTVFAMKFARMWHHDAVVLNGNPLDRLVLGSDNVGRFPYHRYWAQNAAAINDSFENYFTLDAGTYDFRVLARTGPNAGIVTWRVDGVSIGTTDLYDANGVEYAMKAIAGVSITSNGSHTLTGTVTSKNGSSAGYQAALYKYHFREP